MKYFPKVFQNVYITGVGSFLPGEAISNERIDDFIAPLNSLSHRIKERILKDNGIQTRHYGIDAEGKTLYSATELAAQAVKDGLSHAGAELSDITLLVSGTSGGDVLAPGMGNMLQGELKAPPLETHSHHGICAAGMAALKDAANFIDNGSHHHAVVSAVEFPSRLFKKTRFAPLEYNIDFDAHFLRWMLSDGAGACVLSSAPDSKHNVAFKVDWIHMKSFSGDYPVCMQLGKHHNHSETSFMDYASFAEAEAHGALALRQNTRLLPQLFEVGVHEYSELVSHGYVDPNTVDHFLCHYSSEKLGHVVDELMNKAGLSIDRNKWFSNLTRCGNTGSASIFIMLAEFARCKTLYPGQRIFCFVPESGRFTVSYMMLTVVASDNPKNESGAVNPRPLPAPPHDPGDVNDHNLRNTLRELASIWHEYRSNVWRTPIVKKILAGQFTTPDYIGWMESWIPQVREGSQWMREGIANLPSSLAGLADLIETHAGEEQDDFQILFDDYRAAGGAREDIDTLRRNPGGEALNAFMHSMAAGASPIGLLGGIYIIEGTGQRIIPVLLPMLRDQLQLPDRCFRFLKYHGTNDINHLSRWLKAVSLVLAAGQESERAQFAQSIIQTARNVAGLYLLQWEYVL